MKKVLIIGIILLFVVIINIFISANLSEGYSDMALKYATNINQQNQLTNSLNATNDTIKYDSNNFNIQYHDSVNTIKAQDDVRDGAAYVLDKSGNMVSLQSIGNGVTPTYYQPGSYKYGASTYVPNYEDSIYLSKTTGESAVTPILNQASISKGFCSYYINQPDKLEEACMKTDPNICASTSCCVLLGGSKCVSGNRQGAYMKENYGDTTILNRDYYYFKGKCYGNCPSTNLSYIGLGPSEMSRFIPDNSSNIIKTDVSSNTISINTDNSNNVISIKINDVSANVPVIVNTTIPANAPLTVNQPSTMITNPTNS